MSEPSCEEKIKENIFTRLGVTRPYTVFVAIAIILILGIFAFTTFRMELFPNMNLPFVVMGTQLQDDGEEVIIQSAKRAIAIEGIRYTMGQAAFDALTPLQLELAIYDAIPGVIAGINAGIPFTREEIVFNGVHQAAMGLEQTLQTVPLGIRNMSTTINTDRNDINIFLEFVGGTNTGHATVQIIQAMNNMLEMLPAGFTFPFRTPFVMPIGLDMMPVYMFTFTVNDMPANYRAMGNVGVQRFLQDIVEPELIQAGDVARVSLPTFGPGGQPLGFTYVNGAPAFSVAVFQSSDAVTTEVTRNVTRALNNIDGFEFTETFNQGAFINESINDVLLNLVIGGIFAILILFLFMRNWKMTLAVAIAIPLSIISTFVFMYFMGIGLNIVSMSGLALAVGLLIDNSIIVLENIFRLKEKGLPIRDAAIKGASQILNAIVAATLTTVAVFFPIFFVTGLMMEMFMDLVWVVILALVSSLIVAAAFLPAMVSSFKIGETRESKIGWIRACQNFFSRINRAITNFFAKPKAAISRNYDRALRFSVRHKWATLVVALVMFVGSIGLVFVNGFELMPAMDTGEFGITVTINRQHADGGTDASRQSTANPIALRLNTLLEEHPQLGRNIETTAITLQSGGGIFSGDGTQMDIDIVLQDSRSISTDYATQLAYRVIVEYLRSYYLMPAHGANLNHNQHFIRSVSMSSGMDMMAADSVTVTLSKTVPSPDLQTDIDDLRAAVEFVESELNARLLPGSPNRIAGMLKVESDFDEIVIRRSNRRMTATIEVFVDSGYAISRVQSSVNSLMSTLMAAEHPELQGITQIRGGFDAQMADTMTDMIMALLVGFVLVYLVMVAMFQSFKMPFIVMITVPLAFTGGFLFLWMTGMPLSIVALIGFVILMGVVTNNGIVMIDYINKRRADGLTIRDAAIEGAKVRSRPIIMTAITTIIAMIPLALGLGSSGAIMQPMAVANIGGLTYAMFMSLLVVPAFYCITFFRRDRREQQQINSSELEDEPNAGASPQLLQDAPVKNTKTKK